MLVFHVLQDRGRGGHACVVSCAMMIATRMQQVVSTTRQDTHAKAPRAGVVRECPRSVMAVCMLLACGIFLVYHVIHRLKNPTYASRSCQDATAGHAAQGGLRSTGASK